MKSPLIWKSQHLLILIAWYFPVKYWGWGWQNSISNVWRMLGTLPLDGIATARCIGRCAPILLLSPQTGSPNLPLHHTQPTSCENRFTCQSQQQVGRASVTSTSPPFCALCLQWQCLHHKLVYRGKITPFWWLHSVGTWDTDFSKSVLDPKFSNSSPGWGVGVKYINNDDAIW